MQEMKNVPPNRSPAVLWKVTLKGGKQGNPVTAPLGRNMH